MKKTLITLAALVTGSASALAEGTLVWDLTVTGDSCNVTYGADVQSNVSVDTTGATVTNGVCTSPTGNRVMITDSKSSITMGSSFSFVVQGGLNAIGAQSTWQVLFGLGEDTGHNIKVAATETNEYVIAGETATSSSNWNPDGKYAITDATGNTPLETGMGTYIVTVDATGTTGVSNVTLYLNGSEISTATLTIDSANVGNKLDTFSIGGRPYSTGNSSDFSFTNVQLYDGVLSAGQIASLSGVTPEPTTATLSLLALAGLCARRRRK